MHSALIPLSVITFNCVYAYASVWVGGWVDVLNGPHNFEGPLKGHDTVIWSELELGLEEVRVRVWGLCGMGCVCGGGGQCPLELSVVETLRGNLRGRTQVIFTRVPPFLLWIEQQRPSLAGASMTPRLNQLVESAENLSGVPSSVHTGAT